MATIGVVSLNSGEYKTIDQSNDRFIDFVIASSSFPIFFSPIKIDNEWFIDGGIKQISPFKTAIDLGAVDIDAIITSPQFRDKSFSENPNILDIIKRIINLSSDKIISDDINQTLMYNQLALMGFSGKKVINMNIIRPKESLSDNALDFDLTKIKKMMETGYKDAKNFGKTEKKENDIHN
jgi:NTE family protein